MTKIPRNFMIHICANFIELIIRYIYNYPDKFHIKFGSNVDNDNATQKVCTKVSWKDLLLTGLLVKP